MLRTVDIETPAGPAQAVVEGSPRPVALLMLGHGAGGSIDAPDILAARDAALGAGVAVARVVQPYRVRGSRSPAPAPRLDESWVAVAATLRRRRGWARLPVIFGGRSSGARVACRCANELGAAGVLCLAFPLHPPGRPDKTRLPELTAVAAPVLVIQGSADPFGMPPAPEPGVLVVVDGADHGMKKGLPLVRAAVSAFLTELGLAG